MPTLGELAALFFRTKAEAEGNRAPNQAQALSYATGLRSAAATGAGDRAGGASAREVLGTGGAGLSDLDAIATLNARRAEEKLGLATRAAEAGIDADRALAEQRRKTMDPAELERVKAGFRAELQGQKDEASDERLERTLAAALQRLGITQANRHQNNIVTTPTGDVFRVPKAGGPATPVMTEDGSPLQKPTQGTLDAKAVLSDMFASVGNIRNILRKKTVGTGPGAKLMAGFTEMTGIGAQDRVTLRNEAARLYDLVYLKSGKTINPNEQKILGQYIPDITQDDETFINNVERFVQTLTNIATARGLDLREFADMTGGVSEAQEISDPAQFQGLPVGASFLRGGKRYRKTSETGATPE